MAISDWSTGADIRADLTAWVICAALGWFGGWVHGHNTVAAECKALGGFYVGSSTFECKKAKEASHG